MFVRILLLLLGLSLTCCREPPYTPQQGDPSYVGKVHTTYFLAECDFWAQVSEPPMKLIYTYHGLNGQTVNNLCKLLKDGEEIQIFSRAGKYYWNAGTEFVPFDN